LARADHACPSREDRPARKSQARDRRPSLDELDKLLTHFLECSARRQEEIVRITWADLDIEGNRVLVRDMKNPGEKIGNHVWCDLPEEA